MDTASLTVRGRTFSQEEVDRVRAIVEGSVGERRFAISKKVCLALGWLQENGRLKDRSCRELLRRLDQAGIIRLPPPSHPPVRRRPIPLTERTAPRLAFEIEPRDVGWDQFTIATGNARAEQLWNEYVERYHYLKFGTVVGPQIKYFVEVKGEPVACLSFGGAAWKVEARDRWIGWTLEQRRSHLRFVVNNTRYLLFPWIHVKNLASRILGMAARRLPTDWHDRYGYRPVLMETFVHADRHAGTCYRAANWIIVGETKGRGRMDRHFEANLPRKVMFVQPLVPHARELLTHPVHAAKAAD
jgi:hypothetical protein